MLQKLTRPYLIVALANVAILTVAQIVPSLELSGARDGESVVLLVATLVISVQVGQTVGTQLLIQVHTPPKALFPVVTALCLLFAYVNFTTARYSLASALVVGCTLGLISCLLNGELMFPSTLLQYQGTLLIRNTIWTASIYFLILTGHLSDKTLLLITLLSWVCAAVIQDAIPGVGRPRITTKSYQVDLSDSRALNLTALGCVASLIYRNDANWLRTSEIGTSSFAYVHWTLLAYSTANGIIGFIVVQILYPRLRAARVSGRFGSETRLPIDGSRLCVILGLATISFAFSLFVDKYLAAFFVLVAVIPLTCLATLTSARMHADGLSAAVYLIGVLSIVVMLAARSVSFETALFAENAFLLLALYARMRFRRAPLLYEPGPEMS